VVSSLKDHLQAEGLSQFGPTDIWMSRPCLQAPIPREVSFEVQTELNSCRVALQKFRSSMITTIHALLLETPHQLDTAWDGLPQHQQHSKNWYWSERLKRLSNDVTKLADKLGFKIPSFIPSHVMQERIRIRIWIWIFLDRHTCTLASSVLLSSTSTLDPTSWYRKSIFLSTKRGAIQLPHFFGCKDEQARF
jgi:hypothetical protein